MITEWLTATSSSASDSSTKAGWDDLLGAVPITLIIVWAVISSKRKKAKATAKISPSRESLGSVGASSAEASPPIGASAKDAVRAQQPLLVSPDRSATSSRNAANPAAKPAVGRWKEAGAMALVAGLFIVMGLGARSCSEGQIRKFETADDFTITSERVEIQTPYTYVVYDDGGTRVTKTGYGTPVIIPARRVECDPGKLANWASIPDECTTGMEQRFGSWWTISSLLTSTWLRAYWLLLLIGALMLVGVGQTLTTRSRTSEISSGSGSSPSLR